MDNYTNNSSDITDFYDGFAPDVNFLDDYLKTTNNYELDTPYSPYPTMEEANKNAAKMWSEYPDRYEYQIPFDDAIVKYDDNGIEYTYDREDIGDGFSSTISIREKVSYPNGEIDKDSLSGKRDDFGNIIVTIKKKLSDDVGKKILEIK